MSDISTVLDTLEERRKCTRDALAQSYLRKEGAQRQTKLLTEYRAIIKSVIALARADGQFPRPPYVNAAEPVYELV